MFNKSLNENYKHDKKLVGNYRLLGKYKQYNDSNTAVLNDDMSSNVGYEKKYVTNNKTGSKRKNQKSNKNILNKAQYYIEVVDYNNGMFDGKHFHFDKKWIKKKDYDYFLEKNRRISDIALKKIKFRKYGIGVAMFVIFSLFAAAIDVLPRLKYLKKTLEKLETDGILKTLYNNINGWDQPVKTSVYITLYSILMLILIIVLVIGICRVLRNNEKYNKIKLMSEQSAY
ncbi:Plasmodium exported protein (Pm-fam-a like), unknown function [Plasmodium malariae]|uniref:Fam-m protein n=2 Tax=Plasmodium (Plasmodium) TaxID=418103 RepID=A0A1A8XAE3_PLAMA|nr:Plasmodium exported protein (Pm-fam-a like), unknown function [Plasmodium malariae]